MLRRSHKKTRKGSKCEECRRRHIRCDQQHPSCINCRNSDRTCTYRSAHQHQTGEPPSATGTASDNNTLPPQQPAITADRGEASQGPPPLSSPLARTTGGPLVDIGHLQLFHHFTQSTFLFIDRDVGFTQQLKQTTTSVAFSDPCLMHGILAFSARHISTTASPERARYYADQSTKLQTWAVANFNPAPSDPSQDTCVALFLFSSLTCIHGLADIALLGLEPESFFIRFGHYFGLQRGVRAMIDDHWLRLKESELQVLFQWYEMLHSSKGQGSECDALRQLVAQSPGLSPVAIEAYSFAIEQLQCILDGYNPREPTPVHCVYLTLAWPLLISEKMVDLLVLRRPEALIILAYYGATLDICRDLWMVGRAGKQLVHAVSSYLDSSWVMWLRWPCEMVGIEVL
ncbi:putative C6 finger domain protein [Rosellinia necatrix]|uniref:Putative C6 finger domain protein n=1 Tax=Rosellinia necatrix TaxID=77044 RepID=A0A1W2TTI3_ROSNE|nr:putative C6 finger domain protein [Rosellinia necatrix]